eukprot:3013932-Pleurochrysis_carterae.AAC.1
MKYNIVFEYLLRRTAGQCKHTAQSSQSRSSFVNSKSSTPAVPIRAVRQSPSAPRCSPAAGRVLAMRALTRAVQSPLHQRHMHIINWPRTARGNTSLEC